MFDIYPENSVEEAILTDSRTIQGYDFGEPRNHHPEGKIGIHVKQIMDYIDMQDWQKYRHDMRIIALIHDTFKHVQFAGGRHHAELAYDFSKEFNVEEYVRQIILHHDASWTMYKAWRFNGIFHKEEFKKIFSELDLELMIRFNYADLCTRKKDRMIWFEDKIHELTLPNAPKELIYGTLLS